MKVIHTKDKVTLLIRLVEKADSKGIRITQTTHRNYELREHVRFGIWTTIAWINIYEDTIIVSETVWKTHEELIKRLASIIEDYDKTYHSITIEVRP